MRERTSNGTRFMGTNEFFHSRMVDKAVNTSWSSRETSSRVNLQSKVSILPSPTRIFRNVRWGIDLTFQLLIQSEDKLR